MRKEKGTKRCNKKWKIPKIGAKKECSRVILPLPKMEINLLYKK